MAKFIIWIVEDSGELTKACLKYVVNKVLQKGIEAVGLRLCTKLNKGMSKIDIRNYMDKIYNVKVSRVTTRIQPGKVKKVVEDNKVRKKKSPDIKVAYLTLAEGTFKFPDLFPEKEPQTADKKSSSEPAQTEEPLKWFNDL